MIRLFNQYATIFESLGVGVLRDVCRCEVVEELNGGFELELDYPIDGAYFSEMTTRSIIYAKTNPFEGPQPFRIYNISTPINQIVTVSAEHINYDTSGYPVTPYVAKSAVEAFDKLPQNTIGTKLFTYATDIVSTEEFKIDTPRSVRSVLGGDMLKLYKGEYKFDHFKTYLHKRRGVKTNVIIKYGKNLLDLRQEENCSNVYTQIYPYYYTEDSGLIELPEKFIKAPGEYTYTRTLVTSLNDMVEGTPTEEALRKAANKYIEDKKIGVPKISLDVSFVQLSQSTEYSQHALLDKVQLGDVVTVEFEKAKIKTEARCIKTTYDAITNRYVSVELGEEQKTIADSIVDNNQDLDDKLQAQEDSNKSYMDKALEELGNAITGNDGGYIRLNPPKNPTEILIMDTEDINTATVVWRWNKGGFGVSVNGYNGQFYGLAQNGKFVINEATANKFTAALINTGLLTSQNGKSWINMDSGTFNLHDKIKFDDDKFIIDFSSQDVVTGSDLAETGGENRVWNGNFDNLSVSWDKSGLPPTYLFGAYRSNPYGPNVFNCVTDNINQGISQGILELNPGTTYNVSCYIYVARGVVALRERNTYQEVLTNGTGWQWLELNFTPTTSKVDIYIGTTPSTTTKDSAFHLTGVKVAMGETRTPWVPHIGESYEGNTKMNQHMVEIVNGGLLLKNKKNQEVFKADALGNVTMGIFDSRFTLTATGTRKTEMYCDVNDRFTLDVPYANHGNGIWIKRSTGATILVDTARPENPYYKIWMGEMVTPAIKTDNLYVTSSGVTRIQSTDNYGERLANVYEMSECYFGDLGSGVIKDGVCVVSIDDMIQEFANTNVKYHVFTQVYNGGIFKIERYPTYFIVYGDDGTEFSWELKAKRLDYENYRLDVPYENASERIDDFHRIINEEYYNNRESLALIDEALTTNIEVDDLSDFLLSDIYLEDILLGGE